jgi:hypothetical protein
MNLLQWLRILLYFVQTIISGYLFFWYLPSNITSDKPETCPTQDEGSVESKFFYSWIDKCDITLENDSKKYISWLFYGVGTIKLLFDIMMLYMLTFDGGIKKRVLNNTNPTNTTNPI